MIHRATTALILYLPVVLSFSNHSPCGAHRGDLTACAGLPRQRPEGGGVRGRLLPPRVVHTFIDTGSPSFLTLFPVRVGSDTGFTKFIVKFAGPVRSVKFHEMCRSHNAPASILHLPPHQRAHQSGVHRYSRGQCQEGGKQRRPNNQPELRA